MDVSVRQLRYHIAAVESGEKVVLTVHGRPVAEAGAPVGWTRSSLPPRWHTT